MRFFLVFFLVGLVPSLARAQAEAAAEPPPVLVIVELASSPKPAAEPLPVEAAPVEAAPVEEDADEGELADVAAFEPGFFSLGLSGLVGTREGGDELAPTWTAGLDVGFRLESFVSIGVRRLLVTAMAQRDDWVVGASPYVELSYRPWERVEGYAQGGAGLALGLEGDVGVAPFGGAGVRFFPADFFSIAVEGAIHVPVTDRFVLGHESFPSGAVVLQGGLALSFHLG